MAYIERQRIFLAGVSLVVVIGLAIIWMPAVDPVSANRRDDRQEPVPTVVPTDVPTPEALPEPPVCDQPGRVEERSFRSGVLRARVDYRIYLPPCYETHTEQRYATLYLLPGARSDQSYWDRLGTARVANAMIASGEIVPLIIVMVDGAGSWRSWKAGAPYERYVLGEIVPLIDARERTLADRDHRAIGGISRGGGWALLLATRHPDVFGAVGGHSAAFGGGGYAPVDKVALAQSGVRVWLDVGESDGMLRATRALGEFLVSSGVTTETHTWPGGHSAPYWSAHLPDYLRFYNLGWAASQP